MVRYKRLSRIVGQQELQIECTLKRYFAEYGVQFTANRARFLPTLLT